MYCFPLHLYIPIVQSNSNLLTELISYVRRGMRIKRVQFFQRHTWFPPHIQTTYMQKCLEWSKFIWENILIALGCCFSSLSRHVKRIITRYQYELLNACYFVFTRWTSNKFNIHKNLHNYFIEHVQAVSKHRTQHLLCDCVLSYEINLAIIIFSMKPLSLYVDDVY